MTKSDFVKQLAEKIAVPTKDTEFMFDTLFTMLRDSVVADGKLTISGFGTFKLKNRKPRAARNPKTGATVQVPASKTISFKASPGMKNGL
jgi:DNA-binding protein HU-beta